MSCLVRDFRNIFSWRRSSISVRISAIVHASVKNICQFIHGLGKIENDLKEIVPFSMFLALESTH